MKSTIGIALLSGLVALFLVLANSFYIIGPGDRGVVVTLGVVDAQFCQPGMGFKWPFISTVNPVSIRVESENLHAECFSSDLQEVDADLTVNYHIDEAEVVKIFTNYNGDIFSGIIAPRVQEALKERTATRSAEQIVKDREAVKLEALKALRSKTEGIALIDELVINDISLSHELELAIEAKMVQQQNADRAKFAQQQAGVDAETEVIKAKGQAAATEIQGQALNRNPLILQLKIIDKWDGHSPVYVSGMNGNANILLPIQVPGSGQK